jgi:hypothetical protein
MKFSIQSISLATAVFSATVVQAGVPTATGGEVWGADRVEVITVPVRGTEPVPTVPCVQSPQFALKHLLLKNAKIQTAAGAQTTDIVLLNAVNVGNEAERTLFMAGMMAKTFPLNAPTDLPTNAGYEKNWVEAGSKILNVNVMADSMGGKATWFPLSGFTCKAGDTNWVLAVTQVDFFLNVAHLTRNGSTEVIYRTSERVEWLSGF